MDRRHRGTMTPQDLLLPEGKLIRTTRGGATALKQLLLDLKKYSFSGYVRTVRHANGRRSEGVVLLRGAGKHFCAGGDLGAISGADPTNSQPSAPTSLIHVSNPLTSPSGVSVKTTIRSRYSHSIVWFLSVLGLAA